MAKEKTGKLNALKRRAILDAARDVFSSLGMTKATMRLIAEEAGVTTGALYSMFGGKDEIYAALLEDSLKMLFLYVCEEAMRARTTEKSLSRSIRAFFDYYAVRPFEAQLGMHSFTEAPHSSLGKERDTALNEALLATLDVFAEKIGEYAPHLSPKNIGAERDAIFCALIGALTLKASGRDKSIGTNADTIVNSHIENLIYRLASK
ncbi:MAG: TetR/AcrR family transcriptional regulator [Parvibaculaceae bacterium]|nr:TetR/AcrR family transcriptional regulator [Parvibaculaceae bacterium]